MSKRTTIRIPDDVYNDLLQIAKFEQRTISNLIVRLLRESIRKVRIDSHNDSHDAQKVDQGE